MRNAHNLRPLAAMVSLMALLSMALPTVSGYIGSELASGELIFRGYNLVEVSGLGWLSLLALLAAAGIAVVQVPRRTAIEFTLYLIGCISFAIGVSAARAFLLEAGAVNITYMAGVAVTPMLCAAAIALSAVQSTLPQRRKQRRAN